MDNISLNFLTQMISDEPGKIRVTLEFHVAKISFNATFLFGCLALCSNVLAIKHYKVSLR
jgi:hypothetical protein